MWRRRRRRPDGGSKEEIEYHAHAHFTKKKQRATSKDEDIAGDENEKRRILTVDNQHAQKVMTLLCRPFSSHPDHMDTVPEMLPRELLHPVLALLACVVFR